MLEWLLLPFVTPEEGIQRFRKRAVKRAAIEMDERRKIEFNENYDNKLKAKLAPIEKRFDDKDRKLRARRGKAEAELYKRLKDDLEPKESTTEGYAQETIKRQIKEVLTTLKICPRIATSDIMSERGNAPDKSRAKKSG